MYNFKQIEKKWQEKWKEEKLYKTKEDPTKKKYYILDMFPYPSGEGLHLGHPKGYSATDIFARMKMMQGYNVLHPMGWDAFGLPAENYALKKKENPKKCTAENIKKFKSQLEKLGCIYDWEREINTTDPSFYKWTQWAFLQMFKKGIAYESFEPIIWCPSCKTGLAMEDLENGRCERCGSEVIRKPMRQWVLKITDYAERMLEDLDKLPEWEESIKEMQKHWIGKSEGAEVDFEINGEKVTVFTTRPDTLFGATYFVLAPEHPLVQKLKNKIKNLKEVENYIKKTKKKSDMDRTELNKEKTGVKLGGVLAINPVNQKEIPVFIADYVLMGYGTGAIMAVPAHDERDLEFAKKYNLPIVPVVLKRGEAKSYLMGAEKITNEDLIKLGIKVVKKHKSGSKEIIIPEKSVNKYKELIKEKLTPGFWNEYIGKEIVFIFKHKNGKTEEIVLNKKTEEKIDKLAAEFMSEKWDECKIWEELAKNDFYKDSFIHTDEGSAINSGFLDGLTTNEAKGKMIEWLTKSKIGKKAVNYKLKDWVFSRQRYWGEPIPIIKCKHCGYEKIKNKIKGELNFREEKAWRLIMERKKIIETRALNPWEPERFFGNIKRGDLIKINNKINNDFEIIRILKVYNFQNLEALFKDKLALKKVFGKEIKSLQKLKTEYSFTADYIDRINKNGLIGWEFEIMNIYENIALPEKELPLTLPDVEKYEPTGTGESPLANITDWVNTTCPKCGGPAKRETNTMPQWAGSSWYYLRYIDPKNSKALIDKEKDKYWSPVDFYVGGAEHATRHLIYARFWHKFLYDIGVVNYPEPFTRLQHVGLVLAEDGRKMSKRWGNVINPDDIINNYGADSLRMYEMFMGPFSQPAAWNTNGLIGIKKFLDRVWNLQNKLKTQNAKLKTTIQNAKILLNKTIKKVGEDIEEFKFNTAVSAMMILVNKLSEQEQIEQKDLEKLILILAPFAPFLAEELWHKLGYKDSIFKQSWPKYDPKLIKDEKIELVIQINGKVRGRIEVDAGISEEEAKKLALENEQIKKWIDGKEIVKIIFVKGKLVNIVIK